MTPVDTTDRTAALEQKIDALTAQVAFLTEEAMARKRQREIYEDLLADASPLAGEAMAVATRELEELRRIADPGDVVHLLRRLVEVAPVLDRALVTLGSLSELGDDAMPLTSSAVAATTARLAELERRGYFRFARAGAGVLDSLVTGFSDDEVEQLGDNVVTILQTIKEITQPEMLTLLQHMINGVQRQQAGIADEPAEAPGLWALLKKLRDPNVRRGMHRALDTLAAVSVETGSDTIQKITTTTTTKGDR